MLTIDSHDINEEHNFKPAVDITSRPITVPTVYFRPFESSCMRLMSSWHLPNTALSTAHQFKSILKMQKWSIARCKIVLYLFAKWNYSDYHAISNPLNMLLPQLACIYTCKSYFGYPTPHLHHFMAVSQPWQSLEEHALQYGLCTFSSPYTFPSSV